MKIFEAQARIAQELVITQRINTAEVVEIEEYYEGKGKGGAGVQVNQSNVNVGVSGHGRKVTKRVYKFIGLHDNNIEVKEQLTMQLVYIATSSKITLIQLELHCLLNILSYYFIFLLL